MQKYVPPTCLFSYKSNSFLARTGFETKDQGNSEMAYYQTGKVARTSCDHLRKFKDMLDSIDDLQSAILE